MEQYNARDLWLWTAEQIWNLPKGRLLLTFDDGETLEVGRRETIFSYYLGAFHRAYPKTRVLPSHHLRGRQLAKGMELEILSNCLWSCKITYGEEVNIEDLALLAYQTINRVYNELTVALRSYVSTISIMDFIDVVMHPKIKEVNDSVKPTRLSIDKTYDRIWSVLCDPAELPRNTVAHMAKSSLVSKGQILQCVGPRDFVTDIDSNIFRRPVLTGYVHGMRSLYDSLVESRSASKALIFSGTSIRDSEYFSREMQLMSATLSRLYPGDCGSTDYIWVRIKPGDLKNMAGKFHVLEDGSLEEITTESRHLVGEMVRRRSVLKCHHPDPYGVCSVCYGTLSYSIPAHTNIGHVSVAVLCEKMSQNLLSTKHLDASAQSSDFEISDFDQKFIRADTGLVMRSQKDGEEMESSTVIKLTERMRNVKCRLILEQKEAANLPDVEYERIDKLAPSNVTSLSEVKFVIRGSDGFDDTIPAIPVSMGSRRSWLTAEALEHVKKHGWKLTERGTYMIDLSDWDVDLPLFQLPFKNADMVQYLSDVKAFVHATPQTGKKRATNNLRLYPTVEKALAEFYNLISSKLTVNITHLETIILSSMVRSELLKDHRLPRPIDEGEIGSYRANMNMRSMGATMAYEKHYYRLIDLQSFTVTERPDSPYDNLLLPYPIINPTE